MSITDPAFPALHSRPSHGWLNDPNGCAYVDGTYHLFFQYNPNGPVHDRIHWGHVTSTDLVRWEQQPIALFPRAGTADAAGCWSGVVALDGEVPTAFYTGIADRAGCSQVMTATSDRSMIDWRQNDQGIVGMPDEADIGEVRDPFLFTFEDRRYAIQGAGYADGTPAILLYRCHTLTDWQYLGPLVTGGTGIAAEHAEAQIWECPQLLEVDGQWVLILSLWHKDDGGHRLDGVAYLSGELSEGGAGLKFLPTSGGLVDAGPDFYAPQALAASEVETRTLLWGWSWDFARAEEDVLAAGWAGVLTYARSLTLRNGELRSKPVAEVATLRRGVLFHARQRGEMVASEPETAEADKSEVSRSEAAGAERASFEVPQEERAFDIDSQGPVELVVADGSRETIVASVSSGRILVDGSLVEAFGDDEVARTLRAYPTRTSRFVVRSDAPDFTVYALGL